MKILWTFFFLGGGGGHHKIELVEGVISMYFSVVSKVILTPSAGQFQVKICARCTG